MDIRRFDDITWEPIPPRGGPGRRLSRLVGTLTGLLVVSVALGVLTALLVLPALLGPGIAAREASRYIAALPSGLTEPPLPQQSVILAADGTVIARLFAYDRVPVAGTAMSHWIREAVVDTEDSRFYEHAGYDPVGIARAMVANAHGGGGLQGASSITQQYVKNVLVLDEELGTDLATRGNEVSLTRKIRELKLAVAVDREYSKDEILTKYLNIAYFGNGAYGIEAAARRYFSTSAADLTADQAATLTTLLKNPTAYDPLRYPQVARERRKIVLGRMVDQGDLSADRARRLARHRLGLHPSSPRHGCLESDYPFYCAEVLNELTNDPAFGATPEARARLLAVGGLRIQTPMRPAAMRYATRAAKSTVPPAHPVATAISVVKPGTGEVVAIGTNRDYGVTGPAQTEIVLPTVAAFQPGSTFKMFTLAAAFDQGFPLSTRLPGGAAYTSRVLNNPPKGYFSNSAGSLANPTLTQAAQMSMNTAFVQLEERVGVLKVAEMANRLGAKSVAYTGPEAPSPRDGSFTLGTASVSVTEMADAYATIAAGGKYCPPVFISAVTDADGRRLAVPAGGCTQVLDRAAADTVAHVLGAVISGGTGEPAYFGRPAAGKTGTTENLGAAWFAGFTPQYAAAVWVGDPRGGAAHPLVNVLGYSHVYGGTLPATVWRKTMADLHRGRPVRPLPEADPSYVTTTTGQLLPAVTGLPLADARARIAVAGARVDDVTYVAAGPGQQPGVVVAQTPAAGVRAPGVDVTLTVTR